MLVLITSLLFFAAPCFAFAEGGVARVDLESAESDVFSQSGEDGVIEKIFEIIEPSRKFVVEFGASDGVRNSNARNLVLNKGWSALQIEGDEKKAAALVKNYADHPQAQCVQAWVFPGNVELLFDDADVPRDLDLLVIDIDSNDYYVWRAIRDYQPKVVMIEINGFFPPPQRMVVEFHPMNYWDRSDYYGASLQSMYELAKTKGYELIYMNEMGNNAIFVQAKYFERFGIEDNSPTALYNKPPDILWIAVGRDPAKPETPSTRSKPLHWEAFDIPKVFRADR